MANTSENNVEQSKIADMFEEYRSESRRTNRIWKNTSGDVVFTLDAELIKPDTDYMLSYNGKRSSILLFPAGSQPFNVHACTVDSVEVRDSAAYLSMKEKHLPSDFRLALRFIRRLKYYKTRPMNDHAGIVECDVWSVIDKAENNCLFLVGGCAFLALLLVTAC